MNLPSVVVTVIMSLDLGPGPEPFCPQSPSPQLVFPFRFSLFAFRLPPRDTLYPIFSASATYTPSAAMVLGLEVEHL